MKSFLSIDWDFFIDATYEQRFTMFPDGGNENLPTSLRDYIWDTYYGNPNLEKLGVIPAFKYFLRLCSEFWGDCLIVDSHRHLFQYVLDNTTADETFEVCNVDFHHDLYNFPNEDGSVNCGNWATELFKLRPNMIYKWVKREDSDTEVTVDVPFVTMTLDEFKKTTKDFQYLFLCRSSVWSPPHLDPRFISLAKKLMGYRCSCRYETGITSPRKYEEPTKFTEYQIMSSIIKP